LRTESERRERVVSDSRLAERLRQAGIEQFVSEWHKQPLFDTLRRFPETWDSVIEKRKNNSPTGLARSLKGMGTGAQPPLWDKLSGLNLPLLLITGELDEKFRTIASEMADLCPNVEVRIIADAGHNVHVEQPALYLDVVRAFLRKER
jgi:2-succinyl-6-hydroxy-2,4-cyclohexadiene-1-carboxylate synthase